jgi:hypothetical protein
MTYGVKIINSSDYIQIDSDYSNFHVIQEGSLSISNSYYGGGRISNNVSIPSQSAVPLVIVSAPVGVFISATVSSSGFSLISMYDATTVNYKVLGVSRYNTRSNDSYGLRVFNSDNSLAFDSGHDRLLITGKVSKFFESFRYENVSIPIDTNVNKWFSVNGLIRYGSNFSASPNEAELYFACAGFASSTVFSLRSDYLFPGPPIGQTWSAFTATSFVGKIKL